jgi:serine protease Do
MTSLDTAMPNKPTVRAATLSLVAFVCGVATANHLPTSPAAADTPSYHLTALARAGVAAPAAGSGARQGAPPAEEARRFTSAFADVAAAVTPAVVRIQTERALPEGGRGLRDRMRDLYDRLPEDHPDPFSPSLSGGTGVLVSPDGLILTNAHVISGASRILVTLADKRVFEATVVGADPTTDIALIVVDETGLPAATLGDSERVRVGEWVVAIGNPAFHGGNTLDLTVTTGIVSAKGRPLDVIRQELIRQNDSRGVAAYAIEDFIQTDAAINPGNSGGPLMDLGGEVIAINTAIASGTGFNQGYGFAVPINMAKRVMVDLLEYGHVRRPLLGISINSVAPEDAQVYGLSRIAGVLVEDFPPNSPAEQAGLLRHDVIVAVADQEVERLGQFQRLVASHRPGDVVEVDVVRFGERHRFSVRLTEAELGSQRVVRTSLERRPEEGLGLDLVDLTPALAREGRFSRAGGALISGVKPNSAAHRRALDQGLVIREINRQPIRSAAEAERVLDGLSSGTVASLLLEDARGATLIRNIRIP